MKRIHPTTGEIFVPHQYSDGSYKLGDPAHGARKHHAENAIVAATLADAESLVSRGYSLRMRGIISGKVNLISPSKILLK